MNTHRAVTAFALLASVMIVSPLALADGPTTTTTTTKTKTKTTKKKATPATTAQQQQQQNVDTTNGEQTDNSSQPSRGRVTDSRKQTAPKTTTIAGQKATNSDEDLDVSVGKTETTSAQNTPNRPDVIESRAEARREGEGRRVTVAPLMGYGFNDLGVGVGARAGYTFDFPVYLGGTFMYHAGSDNIVNRANVSDSSGRFLYPAIEVGYDIGIGPVLVRPYAGGGLLVGRITTVNTTTGIESTSTEKALMVYPGLTAHYIIGKSPVFIGGDARVLLPFENQGPSLTLLGTTGLHL